MRHRRPSSRFHVSPLGILLLGCSSLATPEPHPAPSPKAFVLPVATTARTASEVSSALVRLAQSRYSEAEVLLTKLSQSPNTDERAQAEVGLAELWLLTGRRSQAVEIAMRHCREGSPQRISACLVAAEGLRRSGSIDDAITLLRQAEKQQGARRLRLQLASLLSEKGLSSEAQLLYRALVADYNNGGRDFSNTVELIVTARAAHRLGAFRLANDLYIQAEQRGVPDVETLIYRGELYLDAHDPKHAREVADEALRYAPNHPAALLLFARVRLAESRNIVEAEKHARLALAIDSSNADAYYVLAGLALRDLHFHEVHQIIDQGLREESRHLDLLSLRAAAHFLADETDAYRAATAAVLKLNPDYARLFRLVAEFAEAEHRYTDIIPQLRRALALNPSDSQAHAQLGIALVRSGEESEGRRELLKAFSLDPFDLRVRNTLVLFERTLDHDYTKVLHGAFELRLPKGVEKPLAAIISPWLDAATKEFGRRYGDLNKGPLFLEVYGEQDSFGVRTTGAPANFLQGVCFGRTIVIRLPTDEPVNVGMTLWHELAHVYHLQISNHRVPRWFTEGLAEVETSRKRPEWAREQDLRVYEAYRENRIPAIADMNQAYSHARDLNDLSVAYVTSTYLVQYLVDTYGFAQVPKLLRAWGKGLPSEQVFASTLQVPLSKLEVGFRSSLQNRFRALLGQFVPPAMTGEQASEKSPQDRTAPSKRPLELVQSHLSQGNLVAARNEITELPLSQRGTPNVLWAESLLLTAEGNHTQALEKLTALIQAGHDGYFVRSQQALVYRLEGDPLNEESCLEQAHRYLPSASEPLQRLRAIAREQNDPLRELGYVAVLCKLEETDVALHQRHVELRLLLNQAKEARAAAEALIYIDPLNSKSHELVAQAALANGERGKAREEVRMAAMLAVTPSDRARLSDWERNLESARVSHPQLQPSR